jgi:hypothetical protein
MKVNYEHGAKVIKYQIQRVPGLLEHYLELRACDFEFYIRFSVAYVVYYGNNPAHFSPAISPNPIIRFIF